MSNGWTVSAKREDDQTDKIVGTWRGTGPSALTQTAEITSGRAIFQQGLTATCKDLPYKVLLKSVRRIMV
jgi:hypothetical protein